MGGEGGGGETEDGTIYMYIYIGEISIPRLGFQWVNCFTLVTCVLRPPRSASPSPQRQVGYEFAGHLL